MMGTFGSSMAGSVAGNMIANTMFGGGGEAPAPAAPAPAGYAPPAAAGPVCFFESRQFLECMTQAGEDINYCRQYYDAFKMCNCAPPPRARFCPSLASSLATHASSLATHA